MFFNVPEIYAIGLEFWYLGVCVCVYLFCLFWILFFLFVVCIMCVCVWEFFGVSVFVFGVLCLGVSGLGFCA